MASLDGSMILFRKSERDVQRLHELGDLDGLGQVTEKSGLESSLDVPWHRIRAERDHRDVRGLDVIPEDLQGLDSADAGQIDVHENHVRSMCAGELDAAV